MKRKHNSDDTVDQWCGCKDYDAAITGCVVTLCMILAAIVFVIARGLKWYQ